MVDKNEKYLKNIVFTCNFMLFTSYKKYKTNSNMKIECDLTELEKTGVYIIKNSKNQKVYIGSSIVAIIKRMWHHQAMLRINKHKNSHLQRAFNKYNEDSFSFNILEICKKEKCLEREQYWMDKFQSYNQEFGYNTNPKATNIPSTDKETIKKRSLTMKRRYANGEIKSYWEKGHIPWNKGKDKSILDYSYLKVPKTNTQKLKDSRKINSENRRENIFPKIYVYDINYNFLGEWRSAKDLEEFSLTKDNNLPIKSRFNNERMGKPIKLLQSVNINKSATFGKSYKSLYFSYKPLHQVIDVEKLDKLLETPVEDNQQPS